MRLKMTLIVAALAAAVALPAAFAAPPDGPTDADRASRKAEWKAKKRAMRGKVLREKVGLDESRAAQVEKILDDTRAQVKPFKKANRELRRELRELLKADSNDMKAYEQNLASLRYNHEQVQKLKAAQMDALAKVMNPKEMARALRVIHHRMGKRGHWGKRGKRGHWGKRGMRHHRGQRGMRGDGPPPTDDGPTQEL